MFTTLLNYFNYPFLNRGWCQSSTFWLGVIVFILAFVFVLYSLYLRYEKQLIFQKYGIPFAKPHLLFGSFHYIKHTTKLDNEIDIMEKWIKDYGKVFGYFIGTTPSLVITDLDIIKEILVHRSANYINRPKMAIKAEPVMETLVGLRDQRWQEVRNMLAHAFTASKIKSLFGIMNKKLDVLISLIENNNSKGNPIEFLSLYQGLTLDIISRCAFAMETDCMRKQNDDKFFAAVRDFLKKARNEAIMWAQYFPIVAALMTVINNYWAKSGKATQMIVANLKVAISKRRQTLNEKRIDILQIILDNSHSSSITSSKEKMNKTSPLTDREIIANSWVFLLGGYETTASSLTFASYLLAKHPEIQERLYDEIKSISKKDDETISYDEIKDLKYLDQVLNESMRLYPPVATFLRREANKEDEINNVKIPKEMNILIPIWHIHHNTEFWPEPQKFDPERFSLQSKQKNERHPMAFLPFGSGPRNCIGMRFGQTAAKLALVRILSKYRLEFCSATPDPVSVMVQTVTLLPEQGIYLRAIKREVNDVP